MGSIPSRYRGELGVEQRNHAAGVLGWDVTDLETAVMETRDPAEAVEILDLLLKFFGEEERWIKGRFSDRRGSCCLVGASDFVSSHHAARGEAAERYLADVLSYQRDQRGDYTRLRAALQPKCCPRISPTLNKHVEDLALVVDGASQVHPLPGDPDDHLVEVPPRDRAWAALPQLARDQRAEFQHEADPSERFRRC
jgi:hypothetical protein